MYHRVVNVCSSRLGLTVSECINDVCVGQRDTALHAAAALKDPAILQLLLEQSRADVNAMNGDRSTPLHIAAARGMSTVFSSVWCCFCIGYVYEHKRVPIKTKLRQIKSQSKWLVILCSVY